MIGGQDFVYAMRGDGRDPVMWVSAEAQRKALDALGQTLRVSELVLPQRILDLIPPRPPGHGMHRELFNRTTGEAFDPIAPGGDRGRGDDRVRAAARSRRADDRAERDRAVAARPGRGHRSPGQGDVRSDHDRQLRSRSEAGDRARARRSYFVAGRGGAERAGACHRVAQAGTDRQPRAPGRKFSRCESAERIGPRASRRCSLPTSSGFWSGR